MRKASKKTVLKEQTESSWDLAKLGRKLPTLPALADGLKKASSVVKKAAKSLKKAAPAKKVAKKAAKKVTKKAAKKKR
jgi:hypothetical protein